MKYLIKSILLATMIVFVAAACQEDGPDDPIIVSVYTQFNIAFDQEASIKDENLILKFAEVVEDSRCPDDVQCIWEGRLVITINANNQPLELSIGGQSEPIVTMEGHRITIVEVVEPTPKSGVDAKDSDYIVTLKVEKIQG
jgi:hypothetical protein